MKRYTVRVYSQKILSALRNGCKSVDLPVEYSRELNEQRRHPVHKQCPDGVVACVVRVAIVVLYLNKLVLDSVVLSLRKEGVNAVAWPYVE